MGEIRLGTSGWSYAEWVGPFYPTAEGSKLQHYTRIFNVAEIDSTFYAYPNPGTVLGWTRHSPKNFMFTAKIPQVITHEKKLNVDEGVEDDLYKFIQLTAPLFEADKLACYLLQMPPHFKYNETRLEAFFKTLPERLPFAIEFRNPTWLRQETWRLLKQFHVAHTAVDEPLLPPEMHVTSDIAYVRWHGHGSRPWFNYRYSVEELKPWVPIVREAAQKTRIIYGFFNNHFHGYAPENCLQILEMLGELTPEQRAALERIQEHRTQAAVVKSSAPSLAAFTSLAEVENQSYMVLLRKFLDSQRLIRAAEIADEELTFRELTEKRVSGRIREYSFTIDVNSKTISHDCADWKKVATHMRFCKHLGKVFLGLPPDRSYEILKQISMQIDDWTLESLH